MTADSMNRPAARSGGSRVRLHLAGIAACLLLSACGDTTSPQTNPEPPGTQPVNYTGPAPSTADTQAFKLNFWDYLSADNRCGACHVENGDPPAFVHRDDINIAYLAALPLVDLDDYASSPVVQQVAGGHNCWLPDNSACADIIEGYISAWQGGPPEGGGRQIVLNAPALKDPGSSRNFPLTAQDNDPDSFEKTVYPLLLQHCSECHAENASTAISPFFAGDDVDSAYEAAKAKINLDDPDSSRLVVRLREEFHNCWSSNCQNDAQTLADSIVQFAGAIALTQVEMSLITSKSLTLDDAIIASGGSRYETNTIALWEFKTGTGTQTFDTSGVEPALDLTFSGTVDWVLGDGIEVIDGKAQGSTANSAKLHDMIKATGEYAIEAWVVPGNVTQEDASIISYSAGSGARNFTVAQDLYNYVLLNRTDASSAGGMPALVTDDADEDLQASLQHIVMNFDPVNGRRIYVNGVYTDDADTAGGGSLADWDSSFAFVLGNEPGGGALWKGKIRLVAIHNRALTQEQIDNNFSVGVGKKYFMLFSVAHLVGIPDNSYILFHVEQFDDHAYLFNEPRFINLDENWTPADPIPVKGMRIAINGRETVAGQAFSNTDVTIDSSQYDYANYGQHLSSQGTIVPLEKGPGSDEFFLTFEQMGEVEINPFVEAVPVPPALPPDAEAVSNIGIRTFEEINAMMSDVTGVPVTEPAVQATYATYRQQLPVVEDINTFLASHQMAVAQLSMSYCNVLVNTNEAYFSGFDFTRTAGTAFDSAGRAAVLDPLLTAIMNVDTADALNNLTTQPDETAIRDMLGATTVQDLDAQLSGDSYDSLITIMTQCATSTSPTCDTTTRTREIAKATCAAMLGSAVMLIQ